MARRNRQGAAAAAITIGLGAAAAVSWSVLPESLTRADTAVPLAFGLCAAATGVAMVVSRRRTEP